MNPWGPEMGVHNGNGVIPSDEELVRAAYRYLKGQHVTLWGRSWNVIDEPDVAAEWLTVQVKAVMKETWWPSRR